MTTEENRWNSMDGAQRSDWLNAAGEYNMTFKFLDWQDLPKSLTERLAAVYSGLSEETKYRRG